MGQMKMIKGHGQTTLIERPGMSPANGNREITNNSITDARTRASTNKEQKLLDLRPMPASPPSGSPSQPIEDDMIDEEVDQSQIRGESLVAVLIIKEEDREECWQNCGTLNKIKI